MPSRFRRRLTDAVGLRLTLWFAALFVVAAVGAGYLAYTLLATSLARRDHDALQVKLAEYSERYESGGLRALSRALSAEQAAGSPDSILVRLVGLNADVMLVSAPPAWRAFDLDRLNASPVAAPESWQEVPSPAGDLTLEVYSRLLPDGTLIQVGSTTISREHFLAEVRKVFSLMIIAVVAAGLAGGMVLTHHALGPLRALRNTVRNVARTGRFDERVVADPGGDLVDELGRVFNAMLARIETLVDGMRGALDNVAHDLRTPIARLRARAESALTSSASPDEIRAALAECVEEADRVTALLATLLDISEAETGTMRLTIEAVPVDDVVRETIDLYEDAAEERRVALVSRVAGLPLVRADRQRLRQVLANLVDNALKYTPAGGEVSITASRAKDGVAIAITDTGIGIAPKDLPHIWDRLYRADASRGERGLGLGLSLVRAIVHAHGGQVDVTSAPGQGSTFTVTLPAALRAM